MEQLEFFSQRRERDRILDAMRENHSVYLTTLRSFARVIAMQRGEVTIDDIRAEIAAQGFPMPAEIGADERLFGCVLRCADFVPIGQSVTTRQDRVARSGRGASYVTTYRLRTNGK